MYLGSILNAAYSQSNSDADRTKVVRILELWMTKEFINEQERCFLEGLL
jgi:hypothetical protein